MQYHDMSMWLLKVPIEGRRPEHFWPSWRRDGGSAVENGLKSQSRITSVKKTPSYSSLNAEQKMSRFYIIYITARAGPIFIRSFY